MAKIAKDQYEKTGPDFLLWSTVKTIHPKDYFFAHALGVMSRAERRRMYYQMLKHGLLSGNDKLAHHGLGAFLSYVKRKKETSADVGDTFLEPMWSKEKELRLRETEYRALRICRLVSCRRTLYKDVTPANYRDYEGKVYHIGMEETWLYVIAVATSILNERSDFPPREHWGLPWDSKLIEKAFTFVSTLGTEEEFKRILGVHRDVKLRPEPRVKVLESLKQQANGMTLQQVAYFLRTFPQMPKDMLKIFRVEYVRKDGELALST